MLEEHSFVFDGIAAKSGQQHDRELREVSLHLVNSKNSRRYKTIAPIKLLATGITIILIASVMIYSRVVLTELTEDANSYQNKIAKLDTEYERLEAELEAKTSIKAITEAAEKELGLTKIDSSQIEYVRLTDADDVVVDSSNETKVNNFFESIFQKITNLFL